MRNARIAAALALVVISLVACTGDKKRASPTSAKTPPSSEDATWKKDATSGGAWVAGFFLREESEPCGVGETPQRRWFQIDPAGENLGREEGLRSAYRSLYSVDVTGLTNPLERVPLDLLNAREQEGTVYLDFSHWISETSQFGTCGAAGMRSTFVAMFRHYYPEARRLCLTVEGRSPDDVPGISIFHDSVACPFWQESSSS